MADEGQEGERPKGADPLEDIFRSFRRRASEAQGVDDVAEQHYLVAVECGRAGRVDEAKTALAVATDSPRHRFRAAAMLGRIYRNEGRAVESVEWFERAAVVSPRTSEEGWSLLYHLGVTLEGLQERNRALAVFLELEATAGDYRYVGDRIVRLSRARLGG